MEIFTLLTNVPYLYEALQLLVAGHALAVAVVNMTPTPADDAFLSKYYKYVEMLAGIVTKKAKQ